MGLVNVIAGSTELLISDLNTFTTYSVAVAAVNSAGTGKYSAPFHVTTDSK